MTLRPADIRRLKLALMDAFPNYHDIRMLVAEAEWPGNEQYRLESIAAASLAQDVVCFNLIEWAEKRDFLRVLIRNAQEARPGTLDVLAAELFPPTAAIAAPSNGMMPLPALVMDWLRLERIRRPVCQLERTPAADHLPADALATAVLVGPDIVLSTFMAVGEYFPDDQPVATRPLLQVRFDYLGAAATPSRRSGTTCALADEWHVAADRNLDVALLRLSHRRGDDLMDGPLPGRRGCVVLHGAEVRDGSPVLILQHPKGRPVARSFGVVCSARLGNNQLSYSAGVQPGSAGAPCFDAELRLIAIHQSPHPSGNRGIRADAIRRYLIENGIELE